MELPKFERQPLRTEKELGADSEIFFPSWHCFCCEDSGRISPTLAKLVIPSYDDWHDKPVACQRCDAIDCRAGEHSDQYDQRFTREICDQLAEYERKNWMQTVKAQQRRLNINRLSESLGKSLEMPGTRGGTDEQREARKAAIGATEHKDLVRKANEYLGVETCNEI